MNFICWMRWHLTRTLISRSNLRSVRMILLFSLFPCTRLAHRVNLSYHLTVMPTEVVIFARKPFKSLTCHGMSHRKKTQYSCFIVKNDYNVLTTQLQSNTNLNIVSRRVSLKRDVEVSRIITEWPKIESKTIQKSQGQHISQKYYAIYLKWVYLACSPSSYHLKNPLWLAKIHLPCNKVTPFI